MLTLTVSDGRQIKLVSKQTKQKFAASSAGLLYRISKALATVKDGCELLRVIVAEAQPVFGFYDIGLPVRNRTGKFYTDWATFYAEISPSEANFENRAAQNYQFSPDEPLLQHGFARAAAEGKPFISEMTAEFAAEFEDFSQLRVELAHGIKQFLITTLKFGGEVFGLLTFNSTRENHFNNRDFELFQAIADLIAVAVANIQAGEEIAEREREKSVLLQISQVIATVRSKQDLLQLIIETIKPMLNFYDCGIFVFDREKRTLEDLTVSLPGISPSAANEQLAQLQAASFEFRGSVWEQIFEEMRTAGEPVIVNYKNNEIPGWSDYIQSSVIEQTGYEECLMTILIIGGEEIGAFAVNSLDKGAFSKQQFGFFQNITNQIAVAVSNILANEEILEREQEKSQLLAISEQLATIRDKNDLFTVIFEKLKPVFRFDDAVIAIYSENLKFTQHIHAATVKELRANEHFRLIMSKPIPTAGNPHGEFADYHSPRIVTLEYFLEHYSHHVGVKVLKDFDLLETLIMPLRYGGRLLGTLEFHSAKVGRFSQSQMPLFRNLANQMAVAVSNILANEEVLERTREKSRLLEITELIAQVKANDDLLRLIVDKIKPLFGFEDCGLFVVSADKQTHTDLAAVLPGVSPSEFNERFDAANAAHDISHSGSIVETIIREIETAGEPVLFDFTDLVERFPDYPQFVGTGILELGYRDCLAANLVVRGEPIGMFCLNARAKNFFQPQIFPLFQAVAHSISIAVANILANEEILERTREKSILLSISEDIAGARNAVELLQVIRDKAQQLIPFYDTGILIVEEDGRHHYDLAVNLQGWDDSEPNRKLRELELRRMVHQDSYVEYVMNLIKAVNRPVIEDYQQRMLEFDYPFFVILREFGYQEGIAATLKSGGKTFGTFWLNSLEKNHFKSAQFEIFQALADQVAVAVANILANDEIKNQLAEIKTLKKRLEAENVYLTEELKRNYNFAEIIGASSALNRVFEIIETVAPTDATVLIEGETGTGKELAARAVHQRSGRNSRPLIKINCAALPRELVESELFGHERGSFTGAFERRLGKFELADKGTIFLDEIGELPLEMQVKLLRVLQEKEIERVGGKGTIKLDLRVIAATNRNLAQEVQAGRFRADLYYRLCTVELFIPPLRERRADIEPLTLYFAQKYAAKFSRRISRISTQMLAELHAYDFPGNIRELEHIVEHAVIFSRDEKLILPRPLTGNAKVNQTSANAEPSNPPPNGERQTLQSIEREHIAAILKQTGGRIKGAGGAAEILGLNPATVYFRMKKLGIEKS